MSKGEGSYGPEGVKAAKMLASGGITRRLFDLRALNLRAASLTLVECVVLTASRSR